ncbi:hypothetical protein NL676_025600 [Syzygium grande]|nr:hypothetical protein NL676_025600 [Syzygium grande]
MRRKSVSRKSKKFRRLRAATFDPDVLTGPVTTFGARFEASNVGPNAEGRLRCFRTGKPAILFPNAVGPLFFSNALSDSSRPSRWPCRRQNLASAKSVVK